MEKRTSRHVPKNSIGLIIRFNNLEERNEFINSEEYKKLIGMADMQAHKRKGKLITFWNPEKI